MTLTEVKSSTVKRIGWNDNILFVEFNSGLYQYENVDKKVFEDLLNADSKGKFIGTEIRGKYNYKRIY